MSAAQALSRAGKSQRLARPQARRALPPIARRTSKLTLTFPPPAVRRLGIAWAGFFAYNRHVPSIGLLQPGAGRRLDNNLDLLAPVFWQKRNREEHRYYLLPGMGRSNRRRHRQYFRSALVVGLLVSIVLCTLLYYFSRPRL